MSLVKEAKELTHDLGKGVDVIGKKVSDAFDNVKRYLPFTNFAKKKDSSIHLEVDLPGVKKEEISIHIEEDVLTISAMRSYKNELTREHYSICESAFGRLERRYQIPNNIDTDNIQAQYEDGRLSITLIKLPKAQPRAISIK